LAGHLGLNNLILLYDDNGITIEGSVGIAYSESTRDRFLSMNWNVLDVQNGDTDYADIYDKLVLSTHSNKPTIIFIKTTIGYGSFLSGTAKSHGSPLSIEDVKHIKRKFHFDENKSFVVDDDVKEYFLQFKIPIIQEYHNDYTECIEELKGCNKTGSTREMSGCCLDIISTFDNIIIGSADLSESNKTNVNGRVISKDNYNGNILHYGIREHAMAGIANGLSTCGILPIVSTFLVFITYCLGSIRMSALSNHKVIYVLTHDSFLLGEDGPSHQPIESLTILRSIPNLLVFRPCDMTEVSAVYQYALQHNGPSCIILSRQSVPVLPKYIEYVERGAYIIYEPKQIDLILISTGSEVSLCIDVAKFLNARVVSMPCCELFDLQTEEYKNRILPPHIKKISVEAGATIGWYKYADYTYGIDTFGKSGNANDLRKHFKFTIEDIIKEIWCNYNKVHYFCGGIQKTTSLSIM